MRSEVPQDGLLQIKVLWYVTSCRLQNIRRCLEGSYCLYIHGQAVLLLDHEDEDSMIIRRVGTILPINMVSHPRRPYSQLCNTLGSQVIGLQKKPVCTYMWWDWIAKITVRIVENEADITKNIAWGCGRNLKVTENLISRSVSYSNLGYVTYSNVPGTNCFVIRYCRKAYVYILCYKCLFLIVEWINKMTVSMLTRWTNVMMCYTKKQDRR